jgi:hypothetical protein
MKTETLISAAILLGSVVASGAQPRPGVATGQFTGGGGKTVLKYAYARWEKSPMYPDTFVIAVVLTESPVSTAALAAVEKEPHLYKIMEGGAMQLNFQPDGTIQNFQLSRVGWSLGDLGGKASKFAITDGRLRGEAVGSAKLNGQAADYAVTFDVPLAPRPAPPK